MKSLKKCHKVYLVFFLLVCVLTAGLFVHMVLHPRPHNMLLTAMSGIWVYCSSRWMDPEKFQNPYHSIHPVGEANILLKKAPGVVLAAVAIVLSFGMLYGFWVLDLIFPYHAAYEYSADIARCKADTLGNHSFFPDEIPQGASRVKWVMLPAFYQGSGAEVLIFETDESYIAQTIEQYGQNAKVMRLEENMIFDRYYDRNRLDKLVIYKLYDNEDWNRSHMWGFFVDAEVNRIGYFCQ